jgi:hypothetical protein
MPSNARTRSASWRKTAKWTIDHEQHQQPSPCRAAEAHPPAAGQPDDIGRDPVNSRKTRGEITLDPLQVRLGASADVVAKHAVAELRTAS